MQLVINEFGTFLGKKGNCFQIKIKDRKEDFSADKVNQIIILCSMSLSSSAIKLAIQNNIDIVLQNSFGEPYARIYPCKLGGTTLTRKRQLEAYSSRKGMALVKAFVNAKVKNQIRLLKSLSKTRDHMFQKEISNLEKFVKKIANITGQTIDDIRNPLLGIEGQTAAVYFSCLTKIIPFRKREPESKDIFNITLNYGYGILYSEIERACIIAGLDPYLGFLHTDRYGKPSMVLDLIEEFRQPVIDRVIINLFVKKQLQNNHLEAVGDKIFLTKEGKTKIINAVLKKLHSKVMFNNEKLTFKRIIQKQARMIAKFVLDQTKVYTPFISKE